MATMRALLRFPGEKQVKVAQCPIPALQPGHILIRTTLSVISPGTEATQNAETRMPLLAKAIKRPDLTAQVFDKLRRDGLAATRNAVKHRLDQPIAAGYACCGIIEDLGEGVTGFTKGMRVACGGIDFARHAEWNVVPQNLACPIPDEVSDDNGVFTTLACIALHAIRQGEIGIGMTVAVIGCGLIGQLAIQLAVAAGARVVAIDWQRPRLATARESGAFKCFKSTGEITAQDLADITHNAGCDAVLLCASDDKGTLIDAAATLCRDRGIIVCVGDVKPHANRGPLFRKEITLRQVRSYGPGRYDANYEQLGQDYPIGHARWTIKRNMQAVLDLMADQRITPARLIDARIPLADAANPTTCEVPPLATVIEYNAEVPTDSTELQRSVQHTTRAKPKTGTVNLGIIGAGNFTGATLLPIIKNIPKTTLKYIASTRGLAAMGAHHRVPGSQAISDNTQIFNDPEIDAVIIATRHDSHADLAHAALLSRKHVWVEKPLAVSLPQLDMIQKTLTETGPKQTLMVGHNRRYAPFTYMIKGTLPSGPKHFSYQVRLSPLPSDHWLNQPGQGGRTIGEISHFIDLVMAVSQSPVLAIQCHWINRAHGDSIWEIRFADQSHATVHYTHGGQRHDPKERLHITATNTTIELIDWHKLVISQNGRKTIHRSGGLLSRTPQKGHEQALKAFIQRIQDPQWAKAENIITPPSAQDEIDLCRMILTAAYGCTPA
ncbi:bi-domain-containing oxidoreductase [Thalassospira sp. TSL5-1]|uniref:bi-domain-containing oxidoreductase n=1 Tax=Thalassospira sp. TSL5-1 TaxID=1544451 RepID=UPI00093B3B28|nr:bi-domain-containing oxidoreductase [Thalassospira sp. TSL5-1]OKH86384.1 hypothetical protein LF95_23395 [Thalassospira sp. TSL5-1]